MEQDQKKMLDGNRERWTPAVCASGRSHEALNLHFLAYKRGTHFIMMNSDQANQSILKLGSARREHC